jgi:hypothetical protein
MQYKDKGQKINPQEEHKEEEEWCSATAIQTTHKKMIHP